jgi:glycosyltransferase involved in cell wall biosynthesis
VTEKPRPLVTGVMAAYNAEQFLEASLESMLAQDYEPFEAIVVDDGSTDSTPEILRRYPRAQVITQQNQGASAAYNAGLAAARGELVTIFDADDLYSPDRISKQAAHLIAHPDVGCVMARQEWMNPPPWLGRDAVYGDLDGIPLGSAMFRRAVLEEVGLFDTSFTHGEDMDLMIRLREHGVRVEVLPDIVWYRRYHGDQLTANGPEVNPLLRSLRAKLERSRQDEAHA